MLWKHTFHVYIFPFCMRIFGEQNLFWKYTKAVVKPKVIKVAFETKLKIEGKIKLT